MKITGFNKVNDSHSAALDNSLEISIYDLFNSKFLDNHSKYSDVNLFLRDLGIENEESIETLDKNVLNEKVKNMTDLNDWESLVNTAALEYLKSDVLVKDRVNYDNVPKSFNERIK